MLASLGILLVLVGLIFAVLGRILHFHNIENFGDKTAGIGVLLSVIGMLLN